MTALAERGAGLLRHEFGPSRYRWMVEGVSQPEVEAAFPGWELLSVEDSETADLGWPMNRTSPKWYRFRRIPE